MKKYKSLLIISVVVVLLLGLLIFLKDDSSSNNILSNDPDTILANAKEESASAKQRTDLKEMEQITIDEFVSAYTSSNVTAVLFSDTKCDYCKISEPILKEILTDNNFKIKILYLDDISEEDSRKLVELDDDLASIGTPLLTIVGNKSIINKVDGLTDKGHYLQFFKDNGIIN